MDGHPRPANLVQNWTSRVARRRAERATALNLLTDARAKAAQQRQNERAQDAPDHAISWPVRILTATVALAVLAVVAVIATVVIGTQVGFYVTNLRVRWVDFSGLGIPRPLDLTLFTPIATESIVWACTLMAVVLVLLNRSSVLWTRAMWLFSGIAAFVNSWHAIHEESDFFGGIVKGGLSVAGPIVVHLFILWVRHLRTGKSLEQARADVAIRWGVVGRALLRTLIVVGQHLRHPTIAARATGYYLGIRQLTYGDAWDAAALDYRRRVLAVVTGGRPVTARRGDQVTDRAPSESGGGSPTGTGSDGDPAGMPVMVGPIDRIEADVDDLIDKLLGRSGVTDAVQETVGDQQERVTGHARTRVTDTVTDVTRNAPTRRPGHGKRATNRVTRLRRPARPDVTDQEIEALLPVAREVAEQLGDRLNQHRLLAGMRDRGTSVSGPRRAAVYQAIKAERGES